VISVKALHQLVQVLTIHRNAKDFSHSFDFDEVERTIFIFIKDIELLLNVVIRTSYSCTECLDQLAQVSKELRVLIVLSDTPDLLKHVDEQVISGATLSQLRVKFEEILLGHLLFLCEIIEVL